MTTPAPLATAAGNPILDEIDRAHAGLSPEARQAIQLFHSQIGAPAPPTAPLGVRTSIAAGDVPTRGMPAAALPARGLAPMPEESRAPQPLLSARPASALSPTETEYNLLHDVMTPDELAQGGVHSKLNTGAAGDVPTRGMPAAALPARGLAPMPEESRAPQPLLSARPASALSPTETEYNRLHHVMTPDELAQGGVHSKLNTGASGLEQIHRPLIRIPLEILNAIGTGFAPGLTSAIPGTPLHHQVLANENEEALKTEQNVQNEEQKRGLESAQTGEAAARAEALKNPKAQKVEPAEKVITTDKGFMQWNPATERYDIPAGNPAAKPDKANTAEMYSEAVQDAIKRGVDPASDPKVQEIAAAITALQKQPAEKTENDFEQYYQKYLGDNGLKDSARNRLKARKDYSTANQAPEHAPQVLMIPQGGGEAFVARPGMNVPGASITPSQSGQEQVAANKSTEAEAKAARDAQDDYRLAQTFAANPTPTNDVALLMHFIGATKPDALGKLRLNQNEINLILGTRSSFGDVQAFVQKIVNGQKLTPQQRSDMLNTMKTIAESHGGQTAPAGGVRPGDFVGQTRKDRSTGKTDRWDGKAWQPQ